MNEDHGQAIELDLLRRENASLRRRLTELKLHNSRLSQAAAAICAPYAQLLNLAAMNPHQQPEEAPAPKAGARGAWLEMF